MGNQINSLVSIGYYLEVKGVLNGFIIRSELGTEVAKTEREVQAIIYALFKERRLRGLRK